MTVIANTRNRQQWAEIIGADWRKSIDSILQTGRDLIAAKAELPHGEFMAMVAADLPFSQDVANNLMGVARHPAITNSDNSRNLPATFSVLVELSQLSEADFNDAREKGLITPDLKVKAARSIAGAYNKPEGEVVGGAQHMLPSPNEARQIARETNRLVAASDGKVYSGTTREEDAQYVNRRTRVFRVLEAINLLAECGVPADDWFRSTEHHWLHDFRPGAIDDAAEWLGDLKEAMGVVDA